MWGNAVESVAALSLRDDVDYSRPVAAVSGSFPFFFLAPNQLN